MVLSLKALWIHIHPTALSNAHTIKQQNAQGRQIWVKCHPWLSTCVSELNRNKTHNFLTAKKRFSVKWLQHTVLLPASCGMDPCSALFVLFPYAFLIEASSGEKLFYFRHFLTCE